MTSEIGESYSLSGREGHVGVRSDAQVGRQLGASAIYEINLDGAGGPKVHVVDIGRKGRLGEPSAAEMGEA